MRLTLLTLILGLTMAGAPADAGDEPACTIRLDIMDKEIWTLRVEPDRVAGDRNVLRRDDDVVFGFVWSKPTRLRFKDGAIDGSLADSNAELILTRADDAIEIHGAVGRDRLSAKASDEQIVLANNKMALTLKRAKVPGTATVLVDATGSARITLDGCGLSVLRDRPEIVLLMSVAVLGRVMSLEDIRSQTGLSTGVEQVPATPPTHTYRPRRPRP